MSLLKRIGGTTPGNGASPFLGVLRGFVTGEDAGHAAAEHSHLDIGVFIDFQEQFILALGLVRLNQRTESSNEFK